MYNINKWPHIFSNFKVTLQIIAATSIGTDRGKQKYQKTAHSPHSKITGEFTITYYYVQSKQRQPRKENKSQFSISYQRKNRGQS